MIGPGARQILAPALLTLAAGGLLGFLLGNRLTPPQADGLDPDLAAYHAAAVDVLSLDGEQSASLQVLLHYYQEERARLTQAERVAVEPDLADLDRRFEFSIRDRILRPEQRAAADRLLQPARLPGAGAGG